MVAVLLDQRKCVVIVALFAWAIPSHMLVFLVDLVNYKSLVTWYLAVRNPDS